MLQKIIFVNLPVSVTKSVSDLFRGFKSHLALSSWLILIDPVWSWLILMNPDWFWLDLFAADLAKSLSFFRVASQVELLSEVKMEGRQNFLRRKNCFFYLSSRSAHWTSNFTNPKFFCLHYFTFWAYFPDKRCKLILKYTQKYQYNSLY